MVIGSNGYEDAIASNEQEEQGLLDENGLPCSEPKDVEERTVFDLSEKNESSQDGSSLGNDGEEKSDSEDANTDGDSKENEQKTDEFEKQCTTDSDGECSQEENKATEVTLDDLLREIKSLSDKTKEFEDLLEQKYLLRSEHLDAVQYDFETFVKGVIKKQLTSVAIKIILMYEEFTTLVERQRDCIDNLAPLQIVNTFSNFDIDFDNILSEMGYRSYEDENGTLFDPRRHEIKGTVECEDSEKIRTICESVFQGYENDEGPVVRQKVKVYATKKGVN